MEDYKIRELLESGIDVERLYARVGGNEAFAGMMYNKFLEDEGLGQMAKALAACDTEAAFKACHALKGVCASLGLEKLRGIVSEETELLRAGDIDAAKEKLPALTKVYQETVALIKKYF